MSRKERYEDFEQFANGAEAMFNALLVSDARAKELANRFRSIAVGNPQKLDGRFSLEPTYSYRLTGVQRLLSLVGRRQFTVSIPLRSLSHADLWKRERRQLVGSSRQ
jgi:hypothetical protein